MHYGTCHQKTVQQNFREFHLRNRKTFNNNSQAKMISSSLVSRMHCASAVANFPSRLRMRANVAGFTTSSGGRLLVANPRPTQYQTVIVHEAINPPPGKPFSWTPILIGLGAFMALFPCFQTTMELNKYYKEVSSKVFLSMR